MRERYLRSVRNLLDCPANEKERLSQRLNSAVAAYLEDVPDAGEPDLITVTCLKAKLLIAMRNKSVFRDCFLCRVLNETSNGEYELICRR